MFDILLFRFFSHVAKLFWKIILFTGFWIYLLESAFMLILKAYKPEIYYPIAKSYTFAYSFVVINILIMLYITLQNIIRVITHNQSFAFIHVFSRFSSWKGRKFMRL